jgi:hypothetical protein
VARGHLATGTGAGAICYGRTIACKCRKEGLGGLTAALLAAALITACLNAGTAWAASRSHVKITGPRTAHTGQTVKLNFTGHAASGVRTLRVWLDNRQCATTAESEGKRSGLQSPTDFRVRGTFHARLTVKRSSKGTHVVCAYLVHRTSQSTAARASWRYVTS